MRWYMPIGEDHLIVEEDDSESVEAFFEVKVQYVEFLINDGTADIKFSFDVADVDTNGFTLKPGESIQNLPKSCQKLYCKSAATQPFRFRGLR